MKKIKNIDTTYYIFLQFVTVVEKFQFVFLNYIWVIK